MKNTIKKVAAKAQSRAKKLAVGASAAIMSGLTAFNSFAVGTGGAMNINTDYTVSADIGNTNPEGLIIGLAVWICRLIGIGMLIWGIYGYVAARKDGEAEAMNGAIGKLVSGLVLVCMPAVLRGLGIIG